VTWTRGITGRAAFSASSLTLAYVIALVLTGIGPISVTLEVLALLAWMVLLARVIGLGRGNLSDPAVRPVVRVLVAATVLAVGTASCAWLLALRQEWIAVPPGAMFAGMLLLAICGLVLLEQVVRNIRQDLRWRLRYLNIGLGTLFGFELANNACALMFYGYIPGLMAVQPAAIALASPFGADAAISNSRNRLNVNLSRHFVFRGGMLAATGIGLLTMGILGYLVRALEGDWNAALMTLAALVLVVGLVTISGSTSVRVRCRRWIEENLLASKYDYREEWRRVTAQLTEPSPDFDLPQQVLRALGRVLESDGGAIWRLSPQGQLLPLGALHANWAEPLAPAGSRQILDVFADRDVVIDFEDPADAAAVEALGTTELARIQDLRYLLPLVTESRLFGVAAMRKPLVPVTLTLEDRELLKLIARQAAGFIALREADRELADAEQLNGVNQVAAFIVHDVKTIAAQLTLLVDNAKRHKSNPAFVDDMISTVVNSVQRMERLLVQFRGEDATAAESLDLGSELRETVALFDGHNPAPEFGMAACGIVVEAERSKLRSALGHVIQNAIDAASAAGPEGSVKVSMQRRDPWAEILVNDTGRGMEQQFVEQRLFQPFASTKGVAGMGIGAYQARAYVRSLGGDMQVESQPNEGTRFIIRLPLLTPL
jgi:putative PEP-CTERM system histidine kinase